MAEASINDLLLKDHPDMLIECVLTGNSTQYLGKAYTKEQVNKLSIEEVDKLFSTYKTKLSDQMVSQMVKSLRKLIIRCIPYELVPY